jgi:hypothetical protein
MKDRWCAEFVSGRCKIPIGNQNPSLSEKFTEILEVKQVVTVLTEYNDIMNFLSFYNPEAISSGKIPKTITYTRPDSVTQDYHTCSASNCRSKQRRCDHYK